LQTNAPWGLDRLDQAGLPLNQSYNYSQTAENVNAYIIDTGIFLGHQAFGGRAVSGFDAIDGGDAIDCNGHGTHVAGTVGSSIYGVAKAVKLTAVRVLDCDGSGTISSVVSGIEWVTANHKKPAVANMSLGGGASQAIDDAIAASVKAGVTYVVAAGNSNVSACNSSPARVASAITVGSTTPTDARSSFSNYGSCVSLFAPGSDILSTWYTSSTATNTISGTSMASPHVAGVAALYLSAHPTATPAQVKAAILAGAISGKVSSAGSGSPNLLVNTAFLSSVVPPPPVDSSLLQNGVAISGLSGARASERQFKVQVPAGRMTLRIEISGGSGDADLYVKAGNIPTTSSYDCRPYTSGNTESCQVSVQAGVTYFVMIRGYTAYSGLGVKASY
jgi:serine protease